MPSLPDLSEPLTGSAARLRPVAERDIPEILIAHQDDPQMHVAIGLERPPSGAELGRRIEADPGVRAAGVGALLAIVSADSDDCCGELDVRDVDWDHRRADVALWVARSHRGRGLGADALRLAGRWLIEACGLKRVQFLADPCNVPLRRAAERAGFSEEGTLRGYLRERGRRVDVVVGSLVASDLSELVR